VRKNKKLACQLILGGGNIRCNAYSDGLAAGLRSDRGHPCRTARQIEELDRAYALGLRDGAMMRDCKRRLDAGVRVYQ
jgi:hypothetical protein